MADEVCPRCKRKIYGESDRGNSCYGDGNTQVCSSCVMSEVLESTKRSPKNGNPLQFGYPDYRGEKYWTGTGPNDPNLSSKEDDEHAA